MRYLLLFPLLPLIASAIGPLPSYVRRKGGWGGGWGDVFPSVTIHPYASALHEDGVNIVGSYDDTYDQRVATYLGIPYAEPPVDDLRWRRPLPYNYTEDITAQTIPPACPQDVNNPFVGTNQIDEDCLFLNVYAPPPCEEPDNLLPVIVYLHPGGWDIGSSAAFPGTAFVAHSQEVNQPVIFVTLNYRLGVLGWPTGTAFDHARAGNLGLRDARRALEWVREHIGAFGGDSHKVTIQGHHAGSVMISHLYFDTEIDLFTSAIMSSGFQSTMPIGLTAGTWTVPYDAFVNYTKCNTSYGGDIECLRKVSASDILQAQLDVKSNPNYTDAFIYGPTIDNDLIPDSPYVLLEKGIFANIPFILGQTKDEGTLFTPIDITGDQVIDEFEAYQPFKFNISFGQNITERWYPNVPERGAPFGTRNDTFGLDPAYKQFSALFTDAVFTAPRRHFLRQVNEYGYNRSWTYTWDQALPGASDRYGASHLTDLPYILGDVRVGNSNWTQDDMDLSDLIRAYFLNFTYYGNPNGLNDTNPYIYPDPYVQNTTSPVPNPPEVVNSTFWTEHDLRAGRKDIFQFVANNNGSRIIQDNFREGSVRFLNDHPVEFNY
ncbi:hypothetical protein IAU60_001802 [Kwoniella sp. DSM 27419]